MGLSVYLLGASEKTEKVCPCCDRAYTEMEKPELFTAHITHNLTSMAEDVGIYRHLWRPSELGIAKASDLIEPLETGLYKMVSDPIRCKQFNPPNGWGNYDTLLSFVSRYLDACQEYPDAEVQACR